jgi:hypothetical protein
MAADSLSWKTAPTPSNCIKTESEPFLHADLHADFSYFIEVRCPGLGIECGRGGGFIQPQGGGKDVFAV